ncbi:MAG: flavodoxin family protein [Candidatus Aureabacteria bacterium]|nr:flavodoxin family protein [Candidatus Auribacterota bacterium]
MNILAVMASPRRRGNSEALLDEFLIGVAKAGGSSEKVVLVDLRISPCREDHHCLKTGECSLTDDAGDLFRKMLAAEKIVLASPVFFYALPAQLKALVDRAELYWNRKYVLKQSIPGPARQAFVIMVGATEGGKTFEGSLLTLRHFFLSLNGSIHGSLLYPGIEKPEDLTRRPQILADVREAGKKFVIA